MLENFKFIKLFSPLITTSFPIKTTINKNNGNSIQIGKCIEKKDKISNGITKAKENSSRWNFLSLIISLKSILYSHSI